MNNKEKINMICDVIGKGNNTNESMREQVFSIRRILDEDMDKKIMKK